MDISILENSCILMGMMILGFEVVEEDRESIRQLAILKPTLWFW